MLKVRFSEKSKQLIVSKEEQKNYIALDYESVFYAYYDNTDGKCKKATNEYNPSEVVDILLKNGGDANHRLKNGNTPLFMKLSKKYLNDMQVRKIKNIILEINTSTAFSNQAKLELN